MPKLGRKEILFSAILSAPFAAEHFKNFLAYLKTHNYFTMDGKVKILDIIAKAHHLGGNYWVVISVTIE